MQYLGGKNSLAKYIVPHIQEALCSRRVYCEPFVGGASIVSRVAHTERLASDMHPQLVALYQAVQKGWEPPTLAITAADYAHVKANQDSLDPAWVALVGFGSSFGAKWFGGYAARPGYNFLAGSWRSLQKKMRTCQDVSFGCCSYTEYTGIKDAVIYCDPPYDNTTGYSTGRFDSAAFWAWCSKMAEHNTVLVSEFSHPEGTEVLWQKDRKTILRSNERQDMSETLVRVFG